MPKSIIHITFFFLLLTALSGVWMRLYILFSNVQVLPFDHLLHAHSHIAVLGWAFLAVLIIYFKMTWEYIENKRHVLVLTGAILLVTTSMFITFLAQGYGTYSIILSTIHILIEYWAIFFVFRSLKKVPTIPTISKHFIRASLIMLFISTIGPWSLGAIASQGLQKSSLFDMAIYFYLHFQYDGWLYLMLIGLFVYMLYQRGITLSATLMKWSFWIYITAIFPSYVLTILWYGFGKSVMIFASFGAIGLLLGVVLLVSAIVKAQPAIRMQFSPYIRMLFNFIFLLILSKSIMELALLYRPFGTLIYETRSVVIGYLHLIFLGFISIFILGLFQTEQLLQETNKAVKTGMTLFLAGFIINELILFISGFTTWINTSTIPFQNEWLLGAGILFTSGIICLWSNVFLQDKLKNLT